MRPDELKHQVMHDALVPAVLLDRDGVLNRDSNEFIKSPDELVLLPGAAEAVARLNRAGFVTPVITNQSGIGRGLFTNAALQEIHSKLKREIAAVGGLIPAIYACPHHPGEGCDCRKPKPAMILQAARELNLDLSTSWYIGDKPDDIICGRAAGVRTILALSGKSKLQDVGSFPTQPDHLSADLADAVEWILTQREKT